MNFDPSSIPNRTYNDVAYNYRYGRHRAYGVPSLTSSYGLQGHIGAKLGDSAPILSEKDQPQTVEQLIERGYFAAPRGEPEMAFLYDRKQTSWMALDDVLGQIRHRYEVYKQNVQDLLWGECYAFNELARNGWPATPEQYGLFERRMQDLRSERRAERVTLWRDVSGLRERIPESAQNYLSAFRKTELLDDAGGDPA